MINKNNPKYKRTKESKLYYMLKTPTDKEMYNAICYDICDKASNYRRI